MHIAIIGAGAAGCFASIQLKQRLPEAQVTVYESQRRALAKVAVTGGGRCNLTNSFAEVKSIDAVYPRGHRLMKRLFREFDHRDTYAWFEAQGVRLTLQSDHCVFPESQNAMQVVNTLLQRMDQSGVKLKTTHRVSKIFATESHSHPYCIEFSDAKQAPVVADKIIVTTGGSPRTSGMDFLAPLQLEMIPPVPSLFSVCLRENPITELTGTVVENVTTAMCGTKHKANGPLLITHKGLSGPAILKLTSHAARSMAETDYRFIISLNWLGNLNETEVNELLTDLSKQHAKKQIQSVYPNAFNSRLWLYLLSLCGINPERRWAELGQKSVNRLASTLTNHRMNVIGKNPFKEEFVTCGGVALNNINPSTLECRKHSGIYFAGETLDVDAVTGGFNLQAAWTMGYVAAKSLAISVATQQNKDTDEV